MLSKDGLGLYDEEGVPPISPGTGQELPKESISPPQFWPADLSLKNRQLLSKSEVFQGEVRAQLESSWDQRQQPKYRKDHDRRVSGMGSWKVNRFNAAGVLANDSRINTVLGPDPLLFSRLMFIGRRILLFIENRLIPGRAGPMFSPKNGKDGFD